MARISVHGTEVLRVQRETAGSGDLTVWERQQRVVCRKPNGRLTRLDKLTVRFKPDRWDPPRSFLAPDWRSH